MSVNKPARGKVTEIHSDNSKTIHSRQLTVVGIGASAGGLEALEEFLSHLPSGLHDVAFIIAQHLSPTHKSMMVHLLSRNTELEVKEAAHGATIRGNIVYVTPPDTEISISRGTLSLRKPKISPGPKPSVDVFFASLADHFKQKSIGVILSGTGSDGSQGIVAIKKAGGTTIVQDPRSAKYDGMPHYAIETNHVDHVLPPRKMGALIKVLAKSTGATFSIPDLPAQDVFEGDLVSLQVILKMLSARTGTDFSNYKPSTIGRRIEKRLAVLDISQLDTYLDYIHQTPDELDRLFEVFLIGVTSFFRDIEAFNAIEEKIKEIIAGKKEGETLRVWVAGCATGEEAYTLVIQISQLLEASSKKLVVQIFATDINERAVAFARKGVYPPEAVEDIDKKLLSTYFRKIDAGFEIVKPLRSLILFTKHDLTNNPPFLNLDLVACRNLLIYFDKGLQQRIFPLFHYSLRPKGLLFLGRSESVGPFSDLFATLDEKNKIFERTAAAIQKKIRFTSFIPQKVHGSIHAKKINEKEATISDLVKETFFNTFEHPYVVISDNHDILEIHGDVRLYLTLQPGAMNASIIKLANKELQIDLRAAIGKAIREKNIVKTAIKKFELFKQAHYVRIIVKPLLYTEAGNHLFIVIFEDFGVEELIGSIEKEGTGPEDHARLMALEHELDSTREHLQAYIEELETTNEEMQSLNEEMQSTNEELQSSAEELETSNEQLQSTTEEVQIAYTELKATHDELEKKDALLKEKDASQMALLNNTLQAILLIDKAYAVVSFNGKAEQTIRQVFGKNLYEGGSFVDSLEPGYIKPFIEDFKKAIDGNVVTGERAIANADQQVYWLKFNYTPVVGPDGAIRLVSVSMLDITEAKVAQTELQKTEKLLTSVFNATNAGICITDQHGKFVDVNNEYCKIYGYTRDELLHQPFTVVVPVDEHKRVQKLHDLFIETGKEIPGEWQVQHKDGTQIDIFVSAELLVQADGTRYKVTSIRDVTQTKKFKELLTETQDIAQIGGWELGLNVGHFALTEEAYRLTNINPGEKVLFTDIAEHLTETDAKKLNFAFDRAWSHGDPFDLELEFNPGLAKSKWIRITCKPFRTKRKTIKLFGTFQDVSKRKVSEILLLQSEDKYRSIIENSINAFFLTKPDGSIVDANQAAEQMFGYTIAEFQKLGRLGIIDHEDPRVAELLEIRAKEGKVKGEVTGIRKNGERFPCEVASVIFTDITGESRTSTIIIDISERRAREREIALLMQNTEENFVLVDKNLRIVTFNDQFRRRYDKYLGKTVEKGANILDFAQPERREILKGIYNRVLAGDTEDAEIQVPVPDNTIKHFALRYKPAYDENREIMGAFVTISDITARKTAELLQKDNEKRYRALVENGGDAVVILTTEGTPTYLSPSIQRILGYSEAEASQLNLFEILHPDDVPGVQDAFAKALQTKGIPVPGHTSRLKHKDGTWHWYEATLTNMLHDPAINGIIDNFRDVTKRVKAEEELKQARHFLERAQEVGKIGHWVSDASVEKGELVWSKQTYRIFGITEEQFDGTIESFFRLVHPEDVKTVQNAALAAFKGERPYDIEHRIVLADKSIRWVHQQAELTLADNGEPLIMIGVVQDITEKKAAELTLQQSEQKYRAMFDSSPLPKWIYDESSLKFLDANNAAIKHYGYALDEFTEMTIDRLELPDDHENIKKHVAGLSKKKGVIHFGQWRHLKKNGDVVLMDTIGHRVVYDNKIAMMIVARDVTEAARHEQQLRESNERFIYASKATSDAIWDWDIEKDTIFWGDGYRTLFGYLLESPNVNNTLWASKVHPEDYDFIWKSILEARQNKTANSWSGEYRFQKANGTYAFVREKAIILRNEKGKPVRMIGALQDVSEGKLAEKRLIEDRNMLRAIIDNIPDHIFVKDLELRQIVSNKALYTEVFNLKSEEEMLGKTMLDYFEPELAEMYEKDDRQVIATGEPILDRQEFTIDRKGEKIWLSTTKVPLRNHKNEVIGLVGIARNITERYIKEVEFQKFTERLNNILESIADPFFALNSNWEYIFMNPAAEKQMGYGRGELIGKDVRTAFPGIEESVIGKNMSYVFETQLSITFELYYPPFNVWYEETIYPTSEGISVYFRDVTARKNAEENLQKAYNENITILESIKDGFYAVNRNWQITYWNKEAEVLLSKTRAEVLGVNVWEVFPDIVDRKFHAVYHQVMENRIPASFEDYFAHTNIWYGLNVYPSEDGISIYFKDISEKKHAEEEIRIAKERYDIVAKVSKDAIYDWDIVHDKITWGEGFEPLFGHKWEDVNSSNKLLSGLIHPDDSSTDALRLEQALQDASQSTWISEYRIKKADSLYSNILERGFIIRNKDGQAIRMIGSLEDISERKQYELTLQDLNRQLALRAEQLAASNQELERFAYVASHDLQEPLRMVSSFLQLLERKYKDQLDEKAFEYISYAVDGAGRMKKLILDLLDYSRVNSVNDEERFEPVDLNQVAADVMDTFQSEVDKAGASVTINLLPTVSGNKEQLIRLLQNLLGNALKYKLYGVNSVVEIGAKENEKEWVIWVKDNGIGIDPKYFDKIFIVFQRLHNKSEFSGTGIGLAICKKIVEKHGGKIWVESAVGKGSTFFVALPTLGK